MSAEKTQDFEVQEVDLDNLWLDVLGMTKKDFDEIDAISAILEDEGFYKGDTRRCLILALAVWVDSGNGIREADH